MKGFVLIVISRPSTPVGLVRSFAGRAAKEARSQYAEIETWMDIPAWLLDSGLGTILSDELDTVFDGLWSETLQRS